MDVVGTRASHERDAISVSHDPINDKGQGGTLVKSILFKKARQEIF
jgi:hypothetical protein